jgi:hypothetical protein
MSYTLPVASTTTLGGVKVDGDTIVINNGIISAATAGAFNSPTITGITTIQHLSEVVTPITEATGTVEHNFNTGSSIFYHTNVADNFTANFTNVPTTNDKSYFLTLIVVQGGTAYVPHAVSIEGVSQNLYWTNNDQPEGTANKTEFFTFNLLRRNNAWLITAGVTTYG